MRLVLELHGPGINVININNMYVVNIKSRKKDTRTILIINGLFRGLLRESV